MRARAALGVIAMIAVLSLPPAAAAQDVKVEIQSGDSIKNVLERQVGKRVAVVLTTGPELAGVVKTVGDKLVHLSELSGREFSDAVVSLDQIGAVVIRVRAR